MATQTRLDVAVDVNLLQSEVTVATVETLVKANKVLRKLRVNPGITLRTNRIDGEVHAVAWSDASWANRRDLSSTGGFIIGMTDSRLLTGEKCHTSVVGWGSNKLKRVARSSLAAELQAMAIAEDELHLVRATWSEVYLGFHDIDDHDGMARATPGTVVIDAKSLYDALTRQTQPLQLSEKRTALELLAYVRNTEKNGCSTRWVHGGANLADSLTKPTATTLVVEFLKTHIWSVVHDEQQMSGKKRRAQGLDKLEEHSGQGFFTLAREALHQYFPYCDEPSSDGD
jgi:hypothetical protein